MSVLNGKTEIIDSNGAHYLVKERLYEMEKILPQYFIRINKKIRSISGTSFMHIFREVIPCLHASFSLDPAFSA